MLPVPVSSVLTKLLGNAVKVFSYFFHLIFPKRRFSIPEKDAARRRERVPTGDAIPRILWQTNFSEKCALPVFLNWKYNRLMSRGFEYRYVSTEARAEFFKNTPIPFMPDAEEIYSKLTNGAAQADFWRIAALYVHGGVYMDIDATLVCPLEEILKNETTALYTGKTKDDLTNFFLATAPGNEDFKRVLEEIRKNILAHTGRESVFETTGPAALNSVMKGKNFAFRKRGNVCVQGFFANEYFQYIDKPRGKWTHADLSNLVKK